MFEYLKAYLEFFTLTKSWRYTGAKEYHNTTTIHNRLNTFLSNLQKKNENIYFHEPLDFHFVE